jgi:hypothetical protein
MEEPFVSEIGYPRDEGQGAATAKIPERRRGARALQMPQTLAEEQHDPPWRNQTDTYSTFKKTAIDGGMFVFPDSASIISIRATVQRSSTITRRNLLRSPCSVTSVYCKLHTLVVAVTNDLPERYPALVDPTAASSPSFALQLQLRSSSLWSCRRS